MLKKLLAFMLCAVMLFAFTACGDEPKTDDNNSTTESQTESTEQTDTESEAPVVSKEDASSKPEASSKPTVTSKPVSSKETVQEITSIDTTGLSGWKKAYAETINANSKYYNEYALVYINNDTIPELYMKPKKAKAGDMLCYFSNNKAITFKLTQSGGGSYIEKGGVIYNEFEVLANNTDTVIFKFDTTGFEKLFFGRFNNDKTNYLMCYELGLVATEKLQATTKQEYEDKVASFINLSKAKKFDAKTLSMSEIAKKLK